MSMANFTGDISTRKLTPREREVLACIGRGLCNKLIARELGLSIATVKSHISAVYATLGVDSRVKAALAHERMDAENRDQRQRDEERQRIAVHYA